MQQSARAEARPASGLAGLFEILKRMCAGFADHCRRLPSRHQATYTSKNVFKWLTR